MEDLAGIMAVPQPAPAVSAAVQPECRGCGATLSATFVDLGSSPPSNAYVRAADLERPEVYYSLKAYVCDRCFLVQLQALQKPPEIFSDYLYFSSYSESWLEHGAQYVARMCAEEALDETSLVLELASNDGYLLRQFAQRAIPVLGIEPARNVAATAMRSGVPTLVEFFGERCARRLRAERRAPRLIVANNVLAHVPDLHDFVAGIAVLLEGDALATVEFPHLLNLLESCEYDTIYHEHFSYFSLLALEPVLWRHGLAVTDVDILATHGGSLRLHLRRAGRQAGSDRVEAIRRREHDAGLAKLDTYRTFAAAVVASKRSSLDFLLAAQRTGRTVVGYGAPAKGNTFLTYCGIRSDLIPFTVDRSPHKQGLFLPGSHIPILAPQALFAQRPDYVLILPWNLAAEIREQLAEIRTWGGRCVTAIPQLRVHE